MELSEVASRLKIVDKQTAAIKSFQEPEQIGEVMNVKDPNPSLSYSKGETLMS
jgi:hypothetical protein